MVEVLISRWRSRFRCAAPGAVVWLSVSLSLIAPGGQLWAAQLTEAEVTRIIKNVEVLPERAAPRPATVKDLIRGGTAVRTGADSRTELTFPDQTLTRLGANTTFSFNEGTRTIDLGAGAMLLYAPKNSGGAKISTAAVTAAITGTTVMIEFHPPRETRQTAVEPDGDAPAATFGLVSRKSKSDRLSSDFIKFITLEGIAQIYLSTRPGEPILVPAGKMLLVSPDGSSVNMIEVNLALLVSSCALITDFPPLGSAPLIADEIAKQQAEAAQEETVVDTDPTSEDIIDQALNGFPLPLGGGILSSEFGPLTTITAPVPYVVNSGTQIVTAPTITTAGVTNQGKIYRNQTVDGLASLYFFGSTSAFDSASGFNALGEPGNPRIPMAAFKFTSLEIDGNPMITVPPGGAKNLGLISEGSITSGGPGSLLTFAGMTTVFLAAQSGSINLGATLAFDNLGILFLYARGVGSSITLGSPMTNMGVVELDAEGSVQVNANEMVSVFNSFTGTFLTGTGVITAGVQVSITGQSTVNFALGQFMIGTNAQVFLTAPNVNIDASANPTAFLNAGLVNVTGTTGINITGGMTMVFGALTQVDFEAGTGGIQAPSMRFFHPVNGITMNATGDIVVQQILGGAFINAGGNITATADISALRTTAGGNINVTGNLTDTQLTSATGPASTIMVGGALTSRDVESTGNVNAGQVSVFLLNQTFTPSNSTLIAGAGGITPYLPAGPGSVHRFNALTVQSPNGINFSGTNFASIPGANGASLFLTAGSQIFGAGGIVGANFNGADAPAPGMSAGSGGTLSVNTGSDLSVNGTTITATTGIIDTADAPSGFGGNVNLTSSTGTVTVNNSQIKVSSNDPTGSVNRRSSARGGNININSGATAGVAVNITSTAQLLSLLETTAPGPGGLITISATAATGNSAINVAGTIQAQNGASGNSAIDIRHSSDTGQINVSSNMLMADIIKIATLGDGSTLNINSGSSISAITLLRLYAGSISAANNSTINFTGTINLTGAQIDIAANTVNLVGAATTVMTSSLAHVYTNNPNYQGSGGTGGPTTGMFTGSGAMTFGLLMAPPLGPPGGGAATLTAPALSTTLSASNVNIPGAHLGAPERTLTRQDRHLP